jgi:hypothetical protein
MGMMKHWQVKYVADVTIGEELDSEHMQGSRYAHDVRVEGGAVLFIVDGEINEILGPTAYLSVTNVEHADQQPV